MEKAKLHVKKGDTVMVISGRKDRTDPKTGEFKPGIKGKTGKVLAVNPKEQTVVVEGLNIIKRAVRPNPRNPQGGFVEKEGPLHVSKVMPVCPSCGKPTRVRKKEVVEGGKTRRIRVCVHCDGALDTKEK